MSGLPWFKCCPEDFLEGMRGLSVEERGAYATIIMLIYRRGGPVPDDAPWIMDHLRLTGKTWARIRSVLISRKKLFEIVLNGDPRLMNQRAAQEINFQAEIKSKLTAAGKKGGGSNKNNAATEAQAKPTESPLEAQAEQIEDRRLEITPLISPSGDIPPKGARTKKPRAIKFFTVPEDWEPKDSHREKVLELGLSVDLARTEIAKFREWEFKDAKVNIDLAFHRWLREAAKRMRSQPHGRGSSDQPNSSGERHLAALRPLAGGAQAALDRRRGRKWGV